MSNKNIKVENNNIVGRLYNLIFALKYTKGSTPEEVFSKVFSLEKNDRTSILSNYAELLKMCTLGIKEVEQLKPKNVHKYKDTLNKVMDGLSKINFNGNNGMERFCNYFDGTLMTSLEYCADYLSEYSTEVDIEDGKIQELIKELDEFIEYVFNCKLHKELEKILIYQLNNVRESLLKYKLYGSQDIMNNISTTLGSLILNREKINSDNDKTIEKLYQIICKINAIVSFKNNAGNLLGSIKKITNGD